MYLLVLVITMSLRDLYNKNNYDIFIISGGYRNGLIFTIETTCTYCVKWGQMVENYNIAIYCHITVLFSVWCEC